MISARELRRIQQLTTTKNAADRWPASFVEWLSWAGVQPSDAQREVSRVAYDGGEVGQSALARQLFGPVDVFPEAARRCVVAVVGGRAGKSYLLVALRLVWGMCVRDLSSLAPGEEAFATVVAPNDQLRQQVVNYALGVCRAVPALRERLRLPRGTRPEDSPSSFGFYRSDADRVITFTGAVATRGGYGVRGRWHTDLALDECAFFRDSSAKVNDKDIYEAGISRVLPGGQVILASTPWAQSGLLYEFFRDNFGHPKTCMVAHAPTLLLNPTDTARQVVETETLRDPDNARREYQAQFMASGSTQFFESATVDASTTDEPFELQHGDQVSAGTDLGLRADSSALVFCALRGGVLHVFDAVECRPQDGQPLSLRETFEQFSDRLRAHRCSYVLADQHYREALYEHLLSHSIAVAPAHATPADRYVRARVLMRARKVLIHPLECRERLVRQLREVQGRPTSGGGMAIFHPRWATGGHGDIADALILALWQLSGDTLVETTEKQDTMLEERRREYVESQAKKKFGR